MLANKHVKLPVELAPSYLLMIDAQVKLRASNITARCFTLQQDNGPKHTAKETKDFFQDQRVECSWMAKSIT